MTRKAPRRTAERIREAALELFNRYGEPAVSTTQIAGELGISPGNLHYHYPAKDGLVNALFDAYAGTLAELLPAAAGVRDVEDLWFMVHRLTEAIWTYRFLYRDLNLLLSRNRHLEEGMRRVLLAQTAALRQQLGALQSLGLLDLEPHEADAVATRQAVLLSYWLSYEFALDPRHALEPERAEAAVLRAAAQPLDLLLPYLTPAPRAHLRQLLQAYVPPLRSAA